LSGNSLAVFPDASEFDEDTMQKIAAELHRAPLDGTRFRAPANEKELCCRDFGVF
jgi:predicted PhzF superfamily epimerase YddE/YHI9